MHRDAAPDCLARWLDYAGERPSDPAAIDGASVITHGELEARTRALASALRNRGAAPEDIVELDVERSVDLVIGAIAVLRAGAAFVPPGHGLRLGSGLRVCRGAPRDPTAVDIDATHGGEEVSIDVPPSPRHLAYLMPTSGSTGSPKGVMVERGNLDALCDAVCERLDMTAADRWLQLAAPSFDVFIEEVFPVLSAGGAVVCKPSPGPLPFDELQGVLAARAVTIVELTTQYFYGYLRWLRAGHRSPPPTLRVVVVGGERMDADAYRAWQHQFEARLVHVYGITETGVSSTMYTGVVGSEATDVPVGRPLSNTRLALLRGEITLGGPCVGRGYLGDPVRTAERFVPDPDGPPGSRRYLSGDWGHFDAEGNLVFDGRCDDELKIRGQRVSTSLLERRLESCDGVSRAVVVRNPGTGTSLTAFLVLDDGGEGELVGDARSRLLDALVELPSAAIPARIVAVASIANTPRGKTDRSALARLALAAPTTDDPVEDTSSTVLEIFRSVLASPELELDDNFFDFGGDSLLALSLASELTHRFRVRLSAAEVFDAPTPRQLARRL